jgi:Ca2+-binding EF-hand superfamily protein
MTSINLSSITSQISSNIFSKLDTSNQGYIDKTTLSGALSDSSDDDVSDLVSSMDTDGDNKISKSELSQGIENLFSQLQSASTQGTSDKASGTQDMPPPPPGGGMGGMPPPKSSDEDSDDEGLTLDQMKQMASDSKDSKLSGMLKDVSENFDAADTDGDGKVTRQEAMEYEKSKKGSSDTSSNSTQTTSSTQQNALTQIAKLVQSYGLGDNSSTRSTLNYSV